MITIVSLFGKPVASLLTSEEAKKDPRGSKAVQSCLPPFLVGKTAGAAGDGRGLRIPPSEDELSLFRSRLVVADDFIECLFIFDAFIDHLDASEGDVFAVGEWCAQRGRPRSDDPGGQHARADH